MHLQQHFHMLFQARRKKKEDAANAKYEDAMKKAKVNETCLALRSSSIGGELPHLYRQTFRYYILLCTVRISRKV